MDTAQRLRDMGIDVWRLRRGVSSQRETPAPGSISARSDADPAARERVPELEPEPPIAAATEASAAPLGTTEPSRVTPEPREPAAAGPPLAAFTVLCLSGSGARLLIAPSDPAAGRRFAADLLAAISGRREAEIRQLEFTWPHPGMRNDRPTMARSLGAFVDRQLDEAGGELVMLGGEVLSLLDRPPPDGRCMALPQTDRLMVDGGLKRALWHELVKHDGA